MHSAPRQRSTEKTKTHNLQFCIEQFCPALPEANKVYVMFINRKHEISLIIIIYYCKNFIKLPRKRSTEKTKTHNLQLCIEQFFPDLPEVNVMFISRKHEISLIIIIYYRKNFIKLHVHNI